MIGKILKKLCVMLIFIGGIGVINVDAAVNSSYAALRSFTVEKSSKTICSAQSVEAGKIGYEAIIGEDKKNYPLSYDAYDTAHTDSNGKWLTTKCTEKWSVDASKLTQADVGFKWITVGTNKYIVGGCYCDKTSYDSIFGSCLDYYQDATKTKCEENRNESLTTVFDKNIFSTDPKVQEKATQTSFEGPGMIIKGQDGKTANEVMNAKNGVNACAHSNYFTYTPVKNKKIDETCLITSVASDKSKYEYKKCSELNAIFEQKVSTVADSLSQGLAGTSETGVTRSKKTRADGYTEVHINLGPEILAALRQIPYDNSHDGVSDLKATIYIDDENNQCSEYFRSGLATAKCDEYAKGSFNSSGELVFSNNKFKDTVVYVVIEFNGKSPCGKYFSTGFDTRTEFIIHDDVPNDNYNAGVCKIIKDAISSNTGTEHESFYKSLLDLVPECTKETLSAEENEMFKSQQAELTALINSLIEVYKNKVNTKISKVDASECTFNPAKNKKLDTPIASYTGIKLLDGQTIATSYWGAICTEDLYIDYDTPVGPVAPGTEFLYETRLKVKRNCTMVQLKAVREKTLCKVTIECQGDDHKGDKEAGPNEDFEACINKCDNGKYTQKCIDKCYKEVYGDESKTSNKTSYNIFDAAVEKNLAYAEKLNNISTTGVATEGCHEEIGCKEKIAGLGSEIKLKKDANGYYLSPDGNYITSCKVYTLNTKLPLLGSNGTRPEEKAIKKAKEQNKTCEKYSGGFKYWDGQNGQVSRKFIDYGQDAFEEKVEGQPNRDVRGEGIGALDGLSPINDNAKGIHEGCYSEGGAGDQWVSGGVCLDRRGGRDPWGVVTYLNRVDVYKIVTENGYEFTYSQGCMPHDQTSQNYNVRISDDQVKIETIHKNINYCYEVLDKKDKNCSFNPKEDYYKELEVARKQYIDMINYLKEKEVPEDKKANYVVRVTETYGKSSKTETSIFVNKQSSNGNKGDYDDAYAVNYKLDLDATTNVPTELPDKKKIGMPKSASLHNYDENTDKEVPLYRYELTRYIKINIGTAYSKLMDGAYDMSKISNYKLSKTASNVIYNQYYTGTGRDPARNEDRDGNISNGPIYGYVLSNTSKLNVNQPYTWPDARVALDNGKYNYTYKNYKDEIKTGYNIFTTATILNEEGEVIPTYTPNISVDIENFGTFKQWTTGKGPNNKSNFSSNKYLVKCMYGTKKEAIGNQIIFRPIDLTNVFPGDETQDGSGDGKGRAPRYNWTGTVLNPTDRNSETTGAALNLNDSYYLKETVDPERLTQYIQSLGEKIYSETNKDKSTYYEYRFELRPATIRDIRKYNKKVGDLNHDGEEKTYIDYELHECIRKGTEGTKTINRNICSSKFLDTYVTFEGGTNKRNQIKICNNGSPTSSDCEKIDIVK